MKYEIVVSRGAQDGQHYFSVPAWIVHVLKRCIRFHVCCQSCRECVQQWPYSKWENGDYVNGRYGAKH